MSYQINDNIRISILIEDQEIPLDAGNALHFLHIVAGSTLILPNLVFSFTDLLQVVPKMKLQDGAAITVAILGALTQTRYFRVHRWRRTPAGDGFSYSIEAYWDAPRFWMGSSQASIRGSSSVVIEQIAATCGLKVWDRNTKTSDTMLWMPGNQTFGKFCRDIARHGYANDKSHMVLGVDSLGTLRYVDVNANPKPKRSVGFVNSNNAGEFMVLSDFQPVNKSGVGNQIAGSRHERQLQSSIVNQDEVETQIQFDPDSRYPLVSEKVRDIQERGTISFGLIDFGNTHPRYERARYQNARYDLLNSVQGEFVFAYQTDFEMADNFQNVSPSELGNKDYDGEFTVSVKVVFIKGSDYQEKLVAVKNGLE